MSVVLLYITVCQLYCVHYCLSVVLLYIIVVQLYCCTLLYVSCTGVHYSRLVVLLYFTVGQLYCCTLLCVSCTAVHYCTPVVLLYITVCQLYCCIFPVFSHCPYFARVVPKEIAKASISFFNSVCLSASFLVTLTGCNFLKFSSWTNKVIPWLIPNVSFHHSVQYSCHLSICCVRSVHPTQSRLTSLCSSALVFFHLSFVPPSGLFLLA